MKRFIPSAFATFAIPFLSMAQTSAPPPDEEKPLAPKAPVPAAETVVPGQPPAAEPPADGAKRTGSPDAKRRGPRGAKETPGAPEDPVTAPGKDTPSAPPGETPGTSPAARGKDRDRGPANRGTAPATPETPGTPPAATVTPGTPPTTSETPGTPPATRGNDRRKGPAGRGTPPSNPETPGAPAATPGTPTTTSEIPGTPSADRRKDRGKGPANRGMPPANPEIPSTPPAAPETPGTPPATRGNDRGKGPAGRSTPPATPETPSAPAATPGTAAVPPTTPGAPPAMPATSGATGTTDSPGTPSATTGARPRPGTRPTDPQQRGVDPSVPPAPAPGAPMPAVTSTPGVPAQRPEGRDRPERPAAQRPPSQETAKVLEDEPKRDRQADAAQARKIDNQEDAKRLLLNILGAGAGAAAVGAGSNDRRDSDPRRRPDGFRPGYRPYRPSVEEVGRTQQDRERTVSSIVERFQGRAPQAVPSGSRSRDQRIFQTTETERRTRFYEGNRRVIRYSSMQEIPPVIVASQQLKRVQVLPQAQSTYSVRPQAPQQGFYQNDIPPSYTTGDAYAVSYSVDPQSAISTDAILFHQGATDFADAYSYDLVIDMADAMKSPALANETFVIEGHASAEGDYGQNLQLSQERAERISRELVRHGVSAERLMPVGYGEAEAASPADAPEADRSLDRRVVVFRMR